MSSRETVTENFEASLRTAAKKGVYKKCQGAKILIALIPHADHIQRRMLTFSGSAMFGPIAWGLGRDPQAAVWLCWAAKWGLREMWRRSTCSPPCWDSQARPSTGCPVGCRTDPHRHRFTWWRYASDVKKHAATQGERNWACRMAHITSMKISTQRVWCFRCHCHSPQHVVTRYVACD